MIPSPISIVVGLLDAESGLTRIYGGQLPDREIISMPRQTVVVRGAGGSILFGNDFMELGDVRLDIFNYGATPREADATAWIVHRVMKHSKRYTAANGLFHWAKPTNSGMNLRDPDTEWPYVLSSWQVLVSEKEVA
jgi:hypothetical protein